jgi:tRNA(His) 5'-end guanylyltransferase
MFYPSSSILECLEHKYRNLELESLGLVEYDTNCFMGFRLDGIKSSKRHLKNICINSDWDLALDKSIITTYLTTRDLGSKEGKNRYICMLSASDEVTFVMNSGPNFWNNRTMKAATTLSGILSGAMSQNYNVLLPNHSTKKNNNAISKRRGVTSFDSRPIKLDDYESVADYLKYRWLIAYRNAMCKVLRLESDMSDNDIYDSSFKNNIEKLDLAVQGKGLKKQHLLMLKTIKLYIPTTDSNRTIHGVSFESYQSFVDHLDNVSAHMRYLHET